MARKAIPKAIRDFVMREFNHRCAICGSDRPQIHHIDENAENNDSQNLLPLCPNCHLTDQHDPTSPVDPRKLSLFRRFKDPLILGAQFEPLFKRAKFFLDIDESTFETASMDSKAEELVEFVSQLEMGRFYGPKIKDLVSAPPSVFVSCGETPDWQDAQREKKCRDEYLKRLAASKERVIELIVELLRYQPWKPHSSTR